MDAAPMFLQEPEGFEGLGAGPVNNPRSGPLGGGSAWPIRAVPHPPGREQSPGLLRSGLTRVREANKSGFVLSKLQGLDERFGKHFMPSEQSDDVELVVVEGAQQTRAQSNGAVGQAAQQHHNTHVVSAEPADEEESPKQPPPWLL